MSDEDKLAALLVRWEEAWDQGEDLSPQQLCADCPELLEELQKQIASLKEMAWVKESFASSAMTDEEERIVPRTFGGRYQIESLIAQGGFGQVFRGFDPELQRPIAIKVPNQITPERAEALLEEARRAAKLRHPRIVSVHDAVRDGEAVFIISDLIEGTNLADLIATRKPSPTEAVRLVAQIAEALHFAHEEGFVHRDIKPANILIDSQGRPLITDFGIAASKDDLARTVTAGTLPYMAPEQVAAEVQLIDARTDIYALGVVLYELLTGRLPYQARTPTALREQILFRSPLSIRAANPAVATAVEAVCLRCLAKHPADRFASAKELAEELERALTAPSKLRKVWPVALALALIVAVVMVVWNPFKEPPFNPWPIETAAVQPTEVTLPVKDGAMVFDGLVRIVTPVERFAPVTMETWARTEIMTRDMFIVGSDIPSRWGLCLGVWHGGYIGVELIGRGWPRMLPKVTPGTWHHLAAVFGNKETVIFFDGKRVDAEPSSTVSGGTPFVIGNVGKQHTILFFEGQILAVRISAGERYSQDFKPQQDLASDSKTVILYKAMSVKGDQVIDLSKYGNHGKVQRLGWR